MKKDDIEKMFSSLEDFSKIPPDDLWNGIEEKLASSKKKKGVAFWWPVAASFLIGLGLLATFYFQSAKEDSLKNIPVQQDNGVVNQSRSEDTVGKEIIRPEIKPENKIVGNEDSNLKVNKSRENLKKINHKIQIPKAKKDALVVNVNKNNPVLENRDKNKIQGAITKNEAFVQENKIIAKDKTAPEKAVEDIKIKENLPSVDLKENALAILEKEQQKKEKTASVEDKWSLQLFAGINSSQNVRNQKSLGNTIESQKGYNYGVKTNYKFNRRWAVRAGLKISDLGQQLANVSYVNSAKSLVNISKIPFSAPTKEKSIVNNPNYLFIPQKPNHTQNTLSATFYETADLSQKMQYLEMPLEVSYAVLNKGKTRVNLNTGGFVGKVISNEVLLNNSAIGKNSDVNEMVFGTVLSSTLQYELYKKTRIFVEPGVNYYSQPVQNQNFNQLQLNFNFGLNISF